MLTRLDGFDAGEESARPFPNPFRQPNPNAVARAAAEALQRELDEGSLLEPGSRAQLCADGKMFGVLVVRDSAGQLGFLRAFSGTFGGRWLEPGFVPPVFDPVARETLETVGEAEVKRLTALATAAHDDPELRKLRGAIERLEAGHTRALAALREVHLANRKRRRELRKQLDASSSASLVDATMEELAASSRRDKTERRQLERRQLEELAVPRLALQKLERKAMALDRLRRFVSRRLMQQIHDTYVISNAQGEERSLRALFLDREPPSGAADCAGPKLLAFAYRNGLLPLAMAEFWWGPPPLAGGRRQGLYYPACRGKCGPVLGHMMEGLDLSSSGFFLPPDSSHLELPVVYADDRVVVVDKPAGLLSVPSTNEAIADSATARLLARYPERSGQLFVHRLDMDTSGLLVAALDAPAHAMLQRQFIKRSIEKCYIAVVEGRVEGDEGVIDLALCPDITDRPRHIHDPVWGRPAVTEWKVLERRGGYTRLAMRPRTGRTHQLRIHASHALGLNAPIVGDKLYGSGGNRLLLHATELTFRHPSTNEPTTFQSPPPF